MSNRVKRTDTSASKQMSLIDTGLSEGCFDISLGLKQLMSDMLTSRKLDRWTVAAQLSKSTGIEISKDTLEKRLSHDPQYQMYAVHMTAITALLSDFEGFRYLLAPLGSDVLDPADRDLIELARIQEKMKVLEAEKLRILAKRGIK